jgi:hypothetical protein
MGVNRGPGGAVVRAAASIVMLLEGPAAPLYARIHRASVWLAQHWEWLWIALLLTGSGLAHGVNMFRFPYYEDDEGTYMSQAWAVLRLGRLAAYTYWYDHAPLGWIQIAGWELLSGGNHSFGNAIDSGRVLMLLMQLASTFMVYRIARTLTNRVTAATVAVVLFALSPFGIYYHRRVLLDNIATLWMLLSILLLVSRQLSLKRVWLSALALGTSILSKELTVVLVPVLAYLVFVRADPAHRRLATVGWTALVALFVSWYPLMAILKDELFPTGTLLGGNNPHVSLLGTLQFQASRGNDRGLLDLQSNFWHLVTIWARDEPMLVVVGSACAVLLLPMLLRPSYRVMGIMSLTTLSLWAFLGRGGEIIGFYLVPLLPLLALNIALMLGLVGDGLDALSVWAARLRARRRGLAGGLVASRDPGRAILRGTLPSAVLFVPALLCLLWAFFGRGGEIIALYLAPLLPLPTIAPVPRLVGDGLDALSVWAARLRAQRRGLAGGLVASRDPGRAILRGTLPSAVLFVPALLCLSSIRLAFNSPGLGFDRNPYQLWNGTQAVAQQQAVEWVETHLPARSMIIIDEYMYTDLHDIAGLPPSKSYAGAHYYWKVQEDPAIRDDVFHDNWHTIDYVITTIQMLTDAKMSDMTLVREAIAHSIPIAHFETGGWPIEVRKVIKSREPIGADKGMLAPPPPISAVYFDSETSLEMQAPISILSGPSPSRSRQGHMMAAPLQGGNGLLVELILLISTLLTKPNNRSQTSRLGGFGAPAASGRGRK